MTPVARVDLSPAFDIRKMVTHIHKTDLQTVALRIEQYDQLKGKMSKEFHQYLKNLFAPLNIYSVIGSYPLAFDLDNCLKQIEKDGEITRQLGVPRLQIELAGEEEYISDEGEEDFIVFLQEISKLAEQRNLLILLEFGSQGLFQTLSQAQTILRRVWTDRFRLMLDPVSIRTTCRMEPEIAFLYFGHRVEAVEGYRRSPDKTYTPEGFYRFLRKKNYRGAVIFDVSSEEDIVQTTRCWRKWKKEGEEGENQESPPASETPPAGDPESEAYPY